MAHPHLQNPALAEFTARIHRTKNRLVTIPAEVQAQLGLTRRADNHLVFFSIRSAGGGRWNHLYSKLTFDNEFAIPAAVDRFSAGQRVDIKIHRVIPDVSVSPGPRGAAVLLDLALRQPSRAGWRTDGSENLDEYLREDAR